MGNKTQRMETNACLSKAKVTSLRGLELDAALVVGVIKSQLGCSHCSRVARRIPSRWVLARRADFDKGNRLLQITFLNFSLSSIIFFFYRQINLSCIKWYFFR